MGGYGHRHMYYLTGLPGSMRFGYSPGWIGRSAQELGPAAQFLTIGQWLTPQMQATPEQELQFLKNLAESLESQLKQVKNRISDLDKSQ